MEDFETEERIEKPYPYSLPIFCQSRVLPSPDGQNIARINEAFELGMSNPTMGKLQVNDNLTIADCNPAFLWSDDSIYLVVPQYISRWFRFRRQRILVIDTQAEMIYASQPQYWMILPQEFKGRIIRLTDTPTRKPKEIRLLLDDLKHLYQRVRYEDLNVLPNT